MRHLVALLLCATALPAFATDSSDPIVKAQTYATTTVRDWMSDSVIVDAVLEQNARNAALTQTDIDTLDKSWRSELGAAAQPTVDSVVKSIPSDRLRARVDEAAGTITEMFVMDALGLNVASSGVTSDFWQGDEAKFTETYPKGADAVHVSDVELDESTQVYQIQVSFPLVNPADGVVIGAVTVALNAEQF